MKIETYVERLRCISILFLGTDSQTHRQTDRRMDGGRMDEGQTDGGRTDGPLAHAQRGV